MSCPTESHNSSVFTGRPLPYVPQPKRDGERSMKTCPPCHGNCNQGDDCPAYQFLTKGEARRFWWTLAVFFAADIALIGFILWVVK